MPDYTLEQIDAEIARREQLAAIDAEIARRQPQQPSKKLNPVDKYLRPAVQGMTFGFGDEVVAGLKSLGGADYDQALASERGMLEARRKQAPGAALAAEALGGMLIPAGGAAKGLSALGRVGQAAKIGGGMGAAYGFGAGEGGAANRARQAGVGGIAGAGGGALLSSGVNALGAAVKSPAAQRLAAHLTPSGGAERGSANLAKAQKLTQAEAALLRELSSRGLPAKELAKGVAKLKNTKNPVYNLADALGDESTWRYTKFLRSSPDANRTVGNTLRARQQGRPERLYKMLDDVVRNEAGESSDDLQRALANRSGRVVKALKSRRNREVGQLYRNLFDERVQVSGKKAEKLRELPIVDNAFKEARKNTTDIFGNLADTDIEVWHEVKMLLDEQVGSAARGDLKGVSARHVKRARDKVVDFMRNQSDGYAEATDVYRTSDYTKTLNQLEGSTKKAATFKKKGLLQDILKIGDTDDPQKIGRSLFGKTPKQLAEVKKAMGEKGQEDIRKTLRGYIESMIESEGTTSETGLGKALGWLDKPINRRRVETLIGKRDMGRFYKHIGKELDIYKTNRAAFEGSPTAGNIEAKGQLKRALKSLFNLNFGDTAEAVVEYASQPRDSKVINEMARALVDPAQGKQSGEKMIGWLELIQRNQRAVDKATAQAGNRSGYISGQAGGR